LKSFKELKFSPGFNLILAQKSPGATDRQTRNGAGKSSIIEIIHFLLGSNTAKGSLFKSASLERHIFGLDFDLYGERIRVERSGEKASRIFLYDASTKNWPVDILKIGLFDNFAFSNEEWKSLLGRLMFSLPLSQEKSNLDKFGPKFRSLISYFIRRESEGGFMDPTRQSTLQSLWDEQVNISFLLGIDWTVSQKWQLIREREKTLNELRKALKEGTLGDYIGTVAELRTQLALSQRKTNQLRENLQNYQVLPDFEQLEKEASALTRELGALHDENSVDNELLQDLRNAVSSEEYSQVTNEINRLYSEVGILLPDLVKKRVEEVNAFHSSIIQNRRDYLSSEILVAEQRVLRRYQDILKKEARKSDLIKILMSHGAVDQFVRLQSELARLEAETEFLRQKLLSAEQLESERAELDIERGQLLLRLQQDFKEQANLVTDAIITFEGISKSLYENAGNLTISESMNGPQFDISIQGQKSTGINKMQIFCFDMMLMILCAKRGIGPGFLVHDSHLFDGVDSRQIAKALQVGILLSKEFDFQYIVMMNDDDLPRENLTRIPLNEYIVPIQLTDAVEDGGLFGFRFD
jgi:uncharacterized protein YydD (DUF2326 family)